MTYWSNFCMIFQLFFFLKVQFFRAKIILIKLPSTYLKKATKQYKDYDQSFSQITCNNKLCMAGLCSCSLQWGRIVFKSLPVGSGVYTFSVSSPWTSVPLVQAHFNIVSILTLTGFSRSNWAAYVNLTVRTLCTTQREGTNQKLF